MIRRVGAVLIALWACRASAIELDDGRITIAGFGQLGVGMTNGNDFLQLDHSFGFDDPDFTLLLSARPIDDLVLSAQVDLSNQGFNLDWVFAEWRFDDAFRLRMGKIKQPFGIYAELRDVGTLRAFYSAPELAYGSSELSSEGMLGVSASGLLEHGNWGINYDVYAGELQLYSDDSVDRIGHRIPLVPGGEVMPLTEYDLGVFGGRVVLTTPVEGLSFRLSAFVSFFTSDTPDGHTFEFKAAVGPTVEYTNGPWMLRGEAFYSFHDRDQRRFAAYAEVARYLGAHLQPAVRFEFTQATIFGATQPVFEHHRELTVALNYWFVRNLVVRAEYHLLNGNLLAAPDSLDDALLGRIHVDPYTHAFLLGVQFSF